MEMSMKHTVSLQQIAEMQSPGSFAIWMGWITFLSLGLVPKSQLMRLVIFSSPRSTSRKSWLSELRGMVMTGASISTSSSSRKPTPA